MSTKQWLRIVVLALASVAGWVIHTPESIFLSGASCALVGMSLIGYYVVKQREQRFAKWLKDAVETEVNLPEDGSNEEAPSY